MTRTEVRICGLGGQGVVLAGQILGRAAVHDGKHVVQTQSYGAEARGSAAKSEVIISDRKIGFPLVRKCDIVVAMSQSALNVHLKNLKETGTLLVDRELVPDISEVKAKVFAFSTTQIAEKVLHSKMYANVIMLGALTQITRVTSDEAMKQAIRDSVRANTVKVNLVAFEQGLRLRPS
jgi:2-oxoglutarate ferredoxin oxidoreductase subunit gamma